MSDQTTPPLSELISPREFLYGREFYELMQAYRHHPLTPCRGVQDAFDAVRQAILAASATRAQGWQEYVQHKSDCKIWMNLDEHDRMVVPASAGMTDKYYCTCGLDALLPAPPPAESKR